MTRWLASMMAGALIFAVSPMAASSTPQMRNAPQKNQHKNKAAADKNSNKNSVAKNRISLLRPNELSRLRPKDQLRYFKNLHEVLVTLERGASKGKSKGRKSASQFLEVLIPEAFAQAEGQPCLIGGYFSTWRRNAAGSLACGEPGRDQVWEVEDGRFFCANGPNGERRAHCNSAFFLYANDGGERMCHALSDLSWNCRREFEARYFPRGHGGGPDLGDPEFPERLVRDTAKLMEQMGKDNLEAYHSELESYLNQMISENSADSQTANLLTNQLAHLASVKALASARVQERPAPAPSPSPSPAPSPSPIAQPENPFRPGSEDPLVPGQPPSQADSRLLGRELSCVRNGLTNLGHNPSERYLALLGAGIQASHGPYNTTRDPEALKSFQTRVIAMVQSYGYCDEAVYPSTTQDSDISTIRRLLTADNGNARNVRGMRYVEVATGAASGTASQPLFRLFGLRSRDQSTPWFGSRPDPVEHAFTTMFARDPQAWERQDVIQRQSAFTLWEGRQDSYENTAFENCHQNAKGKMENDLAFNLDALGRDARAAAVRDPAVRQRMIDVSEASRSTCRSMAESCGLNVGLVCNSRGLMNNPATGASERPNLHGVPANQTQ
jgi:hypothetical protein